MIFRIVLCLILVLVPASVFADAILTNGGFESGDFTGWSTIGDTLVVNSSFGTAPAGGLYQALITNSSGLGSVCFICEHDLPYSGNNSVPIYNIPGLISPLDAFVGTNAGALSTFAAQFFLGVEGSAIRTAFNANALDTLTFDYNFLTDETIFGGPFVEDLAFYVLDGQVSYLNGWNNHGSDPLSPTPFHTESGYRSFSIMIPNSGAHSFALGVMDLEDSTYNTGLLVDNMRLAAVPEPSTWIMFGSGLLMLFAIRKFS